MMALRVLISRLRGLFRKGGRDARLSEEIESHLALLAEERMRQGMSRDDARASARATFGGVEQIKETYRDQRGLPVLETLAQDLRYALRMLRKNPGFATVAVITLALGIGATTAIFSVINAMMLRTLPVERPEELIQLAVTGGDGTDETFSYAAYIAFRDNGAPVADFIAMNNARPTRAAIDGDADFVSRKSVSGNYFAVLGVQAAVGRTLVPDDDRLPAGLPVAVLSHRYWTRRFAADPKAVGRVISIQDTPFTIVGVASPAFSGESVDNAQDVWTPLTVQPGAPVDLWRGHSTTWLRILGRRKSAVTFEQARAALIPIFAAIRSENAAALSDRRFREQALRGRLVVEDGSRGSSNLRRIFSRALPILMGVVGLVLLIACANVANLLLARASARHREIALRAAIGAHRLRLIRQLLVEALLLAALGGALGLLMAIWGSSVLVSIASQGPMPITLDVGPDVRLLAFACAVSLGTAMLFGLIPALHAARPSLVPSLRASSSSSGPTGFVAGKMLVVAQIAMSLVLLVVAGLFVRSLVNLRNIDIGFNADRVLVMNIDGPSNRTPVPAEELRNLYARLIERAEAVPGVRAASVSFSASFGASSWGNRITIDGRPAPLDQPVRTLASAISPRYFEVMGMQLLRGRPFSTADSANAPGVAIVSEAFAREFFGEPSPIGKRVGFGVPAKTMMEIVGIVRDAKYRNLREKPTPMLYVPFTQYQGRVSELDVRTTADPAAVAAELRRELSKVDQRVAVTNVRELQQQVDRSIAAELLIAKLSSFFGILALLLAAVGLYGVIAYVTAQRTAEVGIRMALGADRFSVLWLVLRQMSTLVLVGMLIGVAAAVAASRLIANLLYQVGPYDPVTIVVAVTVLLTAALVAGGIPARRATHVNPAIALKAE